MAVKLANMAASRLAANIGPADLSIQLRAGDGDRFPVLTGADLRDVSAYLDSLQ